MERELFDWDGWDQYDTMCFGFYDVVTKVQLGPVPPGTAFESVTIDYGEGLLELYRPGESTPHFKFSLTLNTELL